MLTTLIIFICLNAILLWLDYWLTTKNYQQFIIQSPAISFEQFELNPRLQEAIKSKQILHPQVILAVFITTLLIISIFVATQNNYLPTTSFVFIRAMILSSLILTNLNHLKQYLTFKYLQKNKNAISGSSYYSYRYSLHQMILYNITIFTWLLVAYFMQPSWHVLGYACGPLIATYAGWRWLRQTKKLPENKTVPVSSATVTAINMKTSK